MFVSSSARLVRVPVSGVCCEAVCTAGLMLRVWRKLQGSGPRLGAPVLTPSPGAHASLLHGGARSLLQPGEPQHLQQGWTGQEIWRDTTCGQVLGGLGGFGRVANTLRAPTSSLANGTPGIKAESPDAGEAG